MITTTERDLFDLFAEYSGMPIEQVRDASRNFGEINQHHWNECDEASWAERARQFYEVADGYVFDLIHANRSKAVLKSI